MKTPNDIQAMKGGEKISMLTCYDATTASLIDGMVDMVLVGDSLGMVMLGHSDTKNVMLQHILTATESVCNGSKNLLIVADLPLGTYDNEKDALVSSQLALKAGAHAVKIERKPDIAAFLVKQSIPVMGHIGLTPQTIDTFSVQGKDAQSAQDILSQAKEMEKAGCFSLVLECIPKSLAQSITVSIKTPTIGIGASNQCDGQVLVIHDMLGLFTKFTPKFVRRYAQLDKEVKQAVKSYSQDVKKGDFPNENETYH